MKIKILSAITSALLLSACGSDGSSSTTANVPESALSINTTNAPHGPASYALYQNFRNQDELKNQLNAFVKAQQAVDAKLSFMGAINSQDTPTSSQDNNVNLSIPASCSTQSSLNWYTPTSQLTGSVISSTIPGVGILGNVLKFGHDIYTDATADTSTGPSLCFTNTLQEIDAQFTQVEQQIQNIKTVMALTDEFIFQEIEQNAQSDLALAYYDYRSQIERIVGNSSELGIYDAFVDMTGLTVTPVVPIATLSSSQSWVSNAAQSMLINGYNIQNTLFSLSGSTYSRDACSTSPSDCVGLITSSPVSAYGYSSSTLMQVMYEARALLFTKIAATLEDNKNTTNPLEQENIIPLYQQYNKFITSLYHQSLVAITADFYMLSTANTINALFISQQQYVDNNNIYVPNVAYIPGAYFQPTTVSDTVTTSDAATTNATNYQSAHKYLDTFYAGLVNQLYANVASFLVTDMPVDDQFSGATYSCWKASAVEDESLTINGNLGNYAISIWSAESSLDYAECKSSQENTGYHYSLSAYKYSCVDSSGDNQLGCYKWATSAAATPYTWTASPPAPESGTQEADAWGSSTYTYSAYTVNIPSNTGYSCWSSPSIPVSSSARPGAPYPWTANSLTYQQCKDAAQSQPQLITINTTYGIMCYDTSKDAGHDLLTAFSQGCYMWSDSSTGAPYSLTRDPTINFNVATWEDLPPGATYGSSVAEINISNDVGYADFVAINAFRPSNNPTPPSNKVPNDPYLQMSSNFLSNSIIYQTPVLNDINTCITSYLDAVTNKTTIYDYYNNLDTNCPAFFPELTDSNGDVVTATVTGIPGDGNENAIFAPIYIDTSSSPVSQIAYGQMYGVTGACMAASEMYDYTPNLITSTIAENGTHYLTCRLWKSDNSLHNENAIISAINNSTFPSGQEAITTSYNQSSASTNNISATTGFEMIKSASSSNLPYITAWYVTDASYLVEDDTSSGTIYFFGDNGSRSGIPLSTPGNIAADATNLTYAINSAGMTSGSAHALAVSYVIDNFSYPLVLISYNRSGVDGNGFAVVQNNILNNVGFIKDGTLYPITPDPSTFVSPPTIPYATSMANNCINMWVGGKQGNTNICADDSNSLSSKAYEVLDYSEMAISPNSEIYTQINGMYFYINGDSFNSGQSGTGVLTNLRFQGTWNSPMWIEYTD